MWQMAQLSELHNQLPCVFHVVIWDAVDCNESVAMWEFCTHQSDKPGNLKVLYCNTINYVDMFFFSEIHLRKEKVTRQAFHHRFCAAPDISCKINSL